MQTITQVPIPVGDEVASIALPSNARLVRLELDPIDPSTLLSWWYVADVEAETAEHRVAPLRTGQGVPAAWLYLASTAPAPRGGVAWHLWRVVDA